MKIRCKGNIVTLEIENRDCVGTNTPETTAALLFKEAGKKLNDPVVKYMLRGFIKL
jgi:hypothetical protein